MPTPWKTSLTTALFALAFSTSVEAQCPMPDGLDGGPCCTVAPIERTPLLGFDQDSLSICWRDCDVEVVDSCVARWTVPGPYVDADPLDPNAPVVPTCEPRTIRLDLLDPASATLKWRGKLRVQYSRTWVEANAFGEELQVWRYLLNGNLRPLGFGAAAVPCPVPPCAAAFGNRVRYTGYLDYALNCSTGTYEFAWMLNHACDQFDHAPGFPRAGAFHPDRAYTFVGPGAGFAPGPIQPIEFGGGTLEAIRRANLPPAGSSGPITCEFEERIQHGLDPQIEFCPCGFQQGPNQYVRSELSIAGVCGTVVATTGPFPSGFVSMGLGTWTDPARYPGVEALRWNTGEYVYDDGCTGVSRTEVFFGVTTLGGFDARQLLSTPGGEPLPRTFVDQSNSLRGGLTVRNVAYISDHFLNLNY